MSPRRRRAHELAGFAAVGSLGYVVDVAAFNLLRSVGDPALLEHKPLTAKAISVTLATLVTYLGNRHWTWPDRLRRGAHLEYAMFFGLNAVGMAIALGCLALSHYVLGFTSALADNVSANVVGLALGTAFRFWAYPRYVFRSAG